MSDESVPIAHEYVQGCKSVHNKHRYHFLSDRGKLIIIFSNKS